jgi:hypothetical protein
MAKGRRTDRDTEHYSGYDEEIDKAKKARNRQRKDSDPMVVNEGFLGVDDLDKLRRRKVR